MCAHPAIAGLGPRRWAARASATRAPRPPPHPPTRQRDDSVVGEHRQRLAAAPEHRAAQAPPKLGQEARCGAQAGGVQPPAAPCAAQVRRQGMCVCVCPLAIKQKPERWAGRQAGQVRPGPSCGAETDTPAFAHACTPAGRCLGPPARLPRPRRGRLCRMAHQACPACSARSAPAKMVASLRGATGGSLCIVGSSAWAGRAAVELELKKEERTRGSSWLDVQRKLPRRTSMPAMPAPGQARSPT